MAAKSSMSDWKDATCTRCALASGRTQIVIATPCRKGGLLAIGEAPGAEEDAQGVGFVGSAGKTLDRILAAHGITRDNYGRANICRCRPPENRKPNAQEISSCVPFLADLIQQSKPKVILSVGVSATRVLCGSGSLHSKIQARDEGKNWGASLDSEKAHPSIRDALGAVRFIVPMPHTSPLSLNRNAPSGEKWSAIAERQIARAVSLMK